MRIDYVKLDPKNVYSVFINNATGRVLKEGDLLIMPELDNTLTLIAKNGADIFYKGTIADYLVADLQDLGSIISLEDLQRYR